LAKAAQMYPAILDDKDGRGSKFHVIRDIVGRRPTRNGGFRLHTEEMELSHRRHVKVKLIHAYGAGGSGYELSWGVAKEVARLALGGEQEGERAQQQPMLKAAL
jgi:glycine/D-amino acid oxidase-like deaminating enzyme